MLTIEVKSNRDIIIHLEVARVASHSGIRMYCITNISNKPNFVTPPDAEWDSVVKAAINCATSEGKREHYDRLKV